MERPFSTSYTAAMQDTAAQPRDVGHRIREWRQRRRMTQLGLALDAEISARHLSFLEIGKAQPSREMVLHLCERLDVPLRERNMLLIAAGYAPVFAQRRLDDPALKPALAAVEQVLGGHERYPALAIDRAWTMVSANRAVASLLAGLPASLLKPPLNVLRLSLHPRHASPICRSGAPTCSTGCVIKLKSQPTPGWRL
jgi:transcriptional regulator with XRE-family HTH domain